MEEENKNSGLAASIAALAIIIVVTSVALMGLYAIISRIKLMI